LAITYALTYSNGVPDPAIADSSRAAAIRAVALAPALPAAHAAMAVYDLQVLADLPRAYAEDSAALAHAPGDSRMLNSIGTIELSLGRRDAGIRHLEAAITLDPRDHISFYNLGFALLRERRYDAARQTVERARVVAPANPTVFEGLAMLALAQGDLPGARAYWRAGLATIDSATLVAYAGVYYDLGWSLDSSEQQLLLSLGPEPFDGDRATRAIVMAQQYYLRGDRARARAYGDTARAGFEVQLRASPGDAQRHVFLGLALAYLGRDAEAAREAERAMVLGPLASDLVNNAYIQHQAARVYIVIGDTQRAMALLRPLLAMPYYLSPAWLRIDPNFGTLRADPDFQRLAGSS
jgi:tetratricopeptide (TPR) repeat protein